MKKDHNKLNKVMHGIRQKVATLREHTATLRNKKYLEAEMDEGVLKLNGSLDSKTKSEKVVFILSPASVFKSALIIIAVLVGCYILFSISSILVLFFVAFFVAAALDPLVDFLQRNKVPRTLAILLIYVIVFLAIALLFANLLPLIKDQLISIAKLVNSFILGISNNSTSSLPFGDQIKPFVDELYKAIDFKVVAVQLQSSLQSISTQLVSLGGNLWSVITQISNGLMNFILILILVFFMTVDKNSLENFCISIFPTKYTPYISHRMQMIRNKIGEWIRGQFIISLVAGIITFIGLQIAGINYSLTIAVITGLCMVIPVFGRVVAAVIAIPVVLNQSPALALFLIIYYIAISQIENNILVPLLMNKAVGLSPIVIIFALLVGFQFFQVLGLVFAIPSATIIAIFARDISRKIHASK